MNKADSLIITPKTGFTRRAFLGGLVAASSMLATDPLFAAVFKSPERKLRLHNLHTGERIKLTYWAEGEYIEESMQDISRLLRDHRTGDVHLMDRELLDLLYGIQEKTETHSKGFHIISGYRSPKTNKMLRKNSNGVAKLSLHMTGKAIDIRIPKHNLRKLQKAAISMKAGGVGYYAKSNFLHVDTGRVRRW